MCKPPTLVVGVVCQYQLDNTSQPNAGKTLNVFISLTVRVMNQKSLNLIQEEPMVEQLHPLVIDEDIVIYDICR